MRALPLSSSLQGLTTNYEVLAGRSAMLGTSVALVVEALTEESLISSAGLSPGAFAALAASVVAVAVVCAGAWLVCCSSVEQGEGCHENTLDWCVYARD
jgi:hypothetical protein